MPTPPTPPTYWWLTVRIDACRTRDERVAAASGDDAVMMWRELHPNVEVIHVRPVPELVDIELEHMSINNNNHDPTRDHDLLSLDELRDLWNAQADAANSWDSLGADEIAWWAQRQALARAGLAQLLAARDALAERHRPDSWSPSTVEPERVAPKSIEERIAEADAAVEASMKRIRKIIATPARQLAAEANRSAVPLPDGPAVPEGREPASVVGEPSDEELDAMERQCYLATEVCNDSGCEYVFEHRRYARAVLARFGHHSPDATKMVGPTEGDAAELIEELRMIRVDVAPCDSDVITRAADLLEQRHPVPVPVSERLPGPEDCDAEGRCWWWYPPVPEQNYGYWIYEDNAVPERSRLEWPDSWLPATALPLPKGEEEK